MAQPAIDLPRWADVTEARLLDDLRRLIGPMAASASRLDEDAAFPCADLAALAEIGVLMAPFPRQYGGLGLGVEPEGAGGALSLFRSLGEGNLAIGRIVEAHVNAVRLLARYAPPTLVALAAADAAAGRLFALWVTDPPAGGLRLTTSSTVDGRKQFCSAAGFARRAVVTAADMQGDIRLAYALLEEGVTAHPLSGGLQGMRAAATGQVVFEATDATPFGAPDDYLREPDFSAGAWRTSAITLGGLDALLTETVRQLHGRGRSNEPHQQARIGQAFIAGETARLWMQEAAVRAEAAAGDAADTVAYVNLARIAVERACLDAMELVQRCLGVAAFVRPNPVERICRDLATYLRQPAPDIVLTEAAAHWMRQRG